MDIKTSMAALQVSQVQHAQSGALPPGAPASAAREFEAMFLTEMVDEMLQQAKITDFGGGAGEDQWRFFLAEAFAGQIAEQGGTGIAQSIERALGAYAAADRGTKP
ncbi:MAG: rod-binding protein [Pseudooceanicola sp.]